MKLSVTCGPMFAGKSTALLGDMQKIPEEHRLVIKPSTDTRSKGFITIHDGIKIPAHEVNPTHGSIIGLITDNIQHVFIDEAQFFSPWLTREIKRLLHHNLSYTHVHLYALDLDSNHRPWPIMKELLPLADEVTKLKARCMVCGADASKTIRLAEDDSLVLIGEANAYEPRCNLHINTGYTS